MVKLNNDGAANQNSQTNKLKLKQKGAQRYNELLSKKKEGENRRKENIAHNYGSYFCCVRRNRAY